jgi:hypothetical protein
MSTCDAAAVSLHTADLASPLTAFSLPQAGCLLAYTLCLTLWFYTELLSHKRRCPKELMTLLSCLSACCRALLVRSVHRVLLSPNRRHYDKLEHMEEGADKLGQSTPNGIGELHANGRAHSQEPSASYLTLHSLANCGLVKYGCRANAVPRVTMPPRCRVPDIRGMHCTNQLLCPMCSAGVCSLTLRHC